MIFKQRNREDDEGRRALQDGAHGCGAMGPSCLIQTGGLGQDAGCPAPSLARVGCRSGQRAVGDPVDAAVQHPAKHYCPHQNADDRQERTDQPSPLRHRVVAQFFQSAPRGRRRQ